MWTIINPRFHDKYKNNNKKLEIRTILPLTCRVLPPKGMVSNAKGRGVFDDSKKTECVSKLRPRVPRRGSIDSLLNTS